MLLMRSQFFIKHLHATVHPPLLQLSKAVYLVYLWLAPAHLVILFYIVPGYARKTKVHSPYHGGTFLSILICVGSHAQSRLFSLTRPFNWKCSNEATHMSIEGWILSSAVQFAL